MTNCKLCNKTRIQQQLVHKELCNSCYRKQRVDFLNKSGKSCIACCTIESLKWYGDICRNCWRKKHDKNDSLDKKLKNILRSRVSKVISGSIKSGSAVRDLGCSIVELKKHLESQFTESMTWDNYGHKGWHIDHIRPLSKFNLTDPKEFKEACSYKNLQPLWAKDNYKKGDKYDC